MIGAESSEIETRRSAKQIKGTRILFFETTVNFYNILSRLIERKRERTQLIKS